MTDKYELIESDIDGLYRVKALRDFGDVRTGDIGGYVAGEHNLSQHNNCWVYGNAQVYGKALVSGNAIVSANAEICNNAEVSGNSRVFGNALVQNNAIVCGSARVFDSARVFGNARVYGNAKVSEYAKVYGKALVYGNAEVTGNSRVTKNVINIIGLEWNITITDNHIKIGCQQHTIEEWFSFDDYTIHDMDSRALKFWNKNKAKLQNFTM